MAVKALTNPQHFPEDCTPRYILKAKNGKYHFLVGDIAPTRRYLWYMSEPKLISLAQLEEEMRTQGRRWYCTDRPSFDLQKKLGAIVEHGAAYVCLRHAKSANKYWFGPRHAEPAVEPATVIVTVAELYLKSNLHQIGLMSFLMQHMRRVLQTDKVYRSGRSMIEVRQHHPTAEQLHLLSLVPGVGKIYAGCGSCRAGDPRGELLLHGSGGIPIQTDQCVLALISGGIDSPVAAYRMMTRGCHVRGIHFLNSTSSTAAVVDKNHRICAQLSRIQGSFEMHYVDMSTLQSRIVAHVPNHNRALLYKWCMLAMAAHFDDARVLVTGDSLGQVASQTLANMTTLYTQVGKPVLAPLVGMHKTYIMEEARRIGTYDYSIEEGEDCCQYMMCKTGANLCMGRRSLRAGAQPLCLAHTALPVTRKSFVDGVLRESETWDYDATAALGAALAADAPAREARRGSRGGAPTATATATARSADRWLSSGTRSDHCPARGGSMEQEEENGPRPVAVPAGTAVITQDRRGCRCVDAAPSRQTDTGHSGAEIDAGEPMAAPPAPPTTPRARPHRLNFDAAAGTCMPACVREAMLEAPEANPNSMHTSGRQARLAMERVRGELAETLCLPAREIYFTSGGTESNNLALHGCRIERDAWSHASTMQHSNVAACDSAAAAPLVRVVDLVNHETGSVNRHLKRPVGGRLHVDACQALTKLDFATLDLSEVDSLSISAHKMHGPIGVGALYLRAGRAVPLFRGGSQEKGVRPGTENVPGIVGLGAALRLPRDHSAHKEMEALVVSELCALGCEVNRRGETSGFIVHATLPVGMNNTVLVTLLSTTHAIDIGTGSACKTGEVNTTVYDTLGKEPAPDRAIRISWDSFTTMADAQALVAALRASFAEILARR